MLKARGKLIGVLHLSLATLATGALVAGNEAGKVNNNWPFYGKDWAFPDDAWDNEPWHDNFLHNKSMT